MVFRVFKHECVKCDKPMGTTDVNIKDLDRMAEEEAKEHICNPCKKDEILMMM